VSTENEQRAEEREVRSDNPDLSPEAAHDCAEERNDPGDAGPPAHGSRTRLLPIYSAIVVTTVLFTILMGVLVGAL
jgi:hypothetical protein